MSRSARCRKVHVDVTDRGCLYCLSSAGPFESEEHMLPRALGPGTNEFAIPPGIVCDTCNKWLGAQVDAPFVNRFNIRFTRAIEGLRGRNGSLPDLIDGRDATAQLDVEMDGRRVRMYAAETFDTGDGGLEFEVRPIVRDPPDVVARTIRALWKMALGGIWHGDPERAFAPEWDHLRQGVLGHPLSGFLLEAPFTAGSRRGTNLRVQPNNAGSPTSVLFRFGGVELATALANGAQIIKREIVAGGWEVRTTDDKPPRAFRFRLDPVDE